MRVGVVGTGYVGLVTGIVLAELGNDVICVEKDLAKLDLLRQGIPPIYEPGVEEMLRRVLGSGHLKISDSIEQAVHVCEVVFIAVGTPPAEDGSPDLTAVKAVATEIGKHIRHHTVIVNKSTVPVGTGDLVEKIILDQGVLPSMFDVVSNPEFLREGSAIQDTLNPDRIVIGSKRNEAADLLRELYAPMEAQTIVTDLSSAELIKYSANAFLAMKISFINAVSRVCELCGANVADVAAGIGSDKRIGNQFLHAGLGWGGSCFPKDVQGMIKTAERLNYDFQLLKAVVEINESQTVEFLRRVEARLGGLANKKIGLMGLAFKANTDDIRDAKSIVIIDTVLAAGGSIVAYDPVAAENVRKTYPNIQYVENVYEVSDGSDAIILVTERNEFRQFDLSRLAACMKEPILFDGRRLYSRKAAEHAGFEYHTVGE